MKVILLEEVKGVGKKDQLVNASDGHARNFLLPRKLAIEATKENVEKLEKQKKDAADRRAREAEAARELAGRVSKAAVRLRVKAGSQGKTFGSIGAKEIAEALREQAGIEVDKKKIVTEPIKALGEHRVALKLHADVHCELALQLVGE